MYDILVVGSGISALSFIDGLRTHKKKVAIIACLRKMIVILNSMVRDGVKWAS